MSSTEFGLRVPIDNFPQDVVVFFQKLRSIFALPSPKNFLEIRTNSMAESVRFNLPTLRLDLGAAVSKICPKSTEDLSILNLVPSGDITVSPDSEGVLEINCSFSLLLGEDIFVNAEPILLNKIRIQLCSEDCLELAKSNAFQLPLAILNQWQTKMENSPRKFPWSLLGYDVVSQFSLVIPDQMAFLCRKNPNLKFEADGLEAAIFKMNYFSPCIDVPPFYIRIEDDLASTVWGCLSDEDSDVSDDNGDGDVMPPTNALTPVNERSDLSGAPPTTRNLPTGADSDDDNEEILANWQELEVTEEMRKADLERMFWANLDNEDETNTDEKVVGSKRKHG